ncbi:YadA-like family protein [Pelistega ratti]|uniref:YadA-like family protein n=1 Tax=Pelistega ratti TaxID=2652177 RepID=UPI00135A5223|nr:YadA-like family protein [Pelistega ratti]
MNKIFKVIWCKVRQIWMVVSELSKSKPVSSVSAVKKVSSEESIRSSLNAPSFKLKTIIAVVPLALAPVVANAYVEIGGTASQGQSTPSANARPGAGGSNTWPYDYNNPGNKSYDDANQQSNKSDGYATDGKYAFGVAIGNRSSAVQRDGSSNGVAIGDYSRATGGLATAIGSFSNAQSTGSTAIGTAARAAGFNSLAIMRQSAAIGDYSAAIGTVAYAKGTASFAFGASATANGDQSIAIGNASPRTLDGISGGGEAKRTKYDGLNNTQSNGARSVAFGTGARTNGDDSFAFGSEARTGGFSKERDGYLQEDVYRPGYNVAEKAIAFGSKAVAMGKASVAFGSNSYGAKENSIAFGVGAMSRETDSIAFGTNASTNNTSSIAFGTNAQASHENVITIGKDSKATRKGAMTIGEGAQSNANNSLALGSGTIINQEDIKNRNAKYTNDGFDVERGVVAIANKGSERRLINLAAGREDTDAVNVKQLSEVNDNLARTIAGNNYTGYSIDGNGRYTYKAPDFYIKNKVLNTVKEAVELAQTNYVSVNADKNRQTDVNSNYDNLGAKARGSIALGEFAGTTTTAENSVAIGLGTKIAGRDAIALGANISNVNDGSIAIGKNAAAGSDNDFSNWANLTNPTTNQKFASEQELRSYFNANQNNNNPIYRAVVGKRANIAIGDGAATKGGRNISIGENAGVGTKDNWNIHNVNIGSEAGQRSKKDYSVAIGYQAGALTEANQTLQNNSVTKDGDRSPSVLIGKEAGKDTISYGTIAIGREAGQNIADSRSVQNIAIGNGAGKGVKSDNGQNNNFEGFGAGANTLIGAAAGENLSGDGTVAIGNLAGRNSKGDNNILMGHLAGSNATNDRSIIMGPQTGSNALNNDRNVLIGNYVNGEKAVSVANSVGLGSSAVVTGNQSISIGRSSQATADNTIAQGTQAKATAENAIALGREANVSANASIALGLGNKVSGSRSTAIGANNTVSGENTVVLGNNITAATNGSVVLGDNSKTEGSHTTETVTQAEVGGYIYTGFVGAVADAGKFVSVGGRGSERQIKNVAAGHIDANSTDAINGSQLYAVASRVEQGWNITSGQTGTGEVTGNTTQTVKMGDTVKVIAGNNIKVTQDGKNLTVATKENVSFTNVTTGNTSLDNNGLTIKNGPSVTNTGINAGNKTITNVANGTNDSDAVNVSQLNKLGNNTIKLGGDKNTATETQQLNKAGGLQFDVVGGDKQKYVETKASGSQVAVDLTKETKDKIDNAANNNLTNITEGGKTIIRNEAKKAIKVVDGKNTTVTKGADGETDTYAVNVQGDLADVTSITNKTGSGKVEFADNGVVNIAGNNPISLNGNRGDITGLTNKTIDGADFAKSGRAATEEQLKLVGDSKIGDNNIRLGGNTGTTDNQALSKQGGLQFNVKGGDNAQYVATTASGTDVTVDLTQDTKDKIDNAANNNLTNITNEGKKVITGLGTVVKAGDNVTVDETSDATTGQKTYTVNAIAQNLGDASLSYKSNGDVNTKQSVKVSDGLDFVNGNYTTASVDKNGVVKYDVVLGEAPTISNGKAGVPGQPGVNGKDGIATVKTVVDIINNSGWLGNATGNVASGSTATATIVKPGTTVNYAAGQNLNIKQDVATNGDHTYTYALEKDLTDINSISNGTNKIELGKDGKTIISGGDVSVDNHKITDVANGTVDANSKDAVNGSQLYATNQNVTNNTQNITKNTDDIAKGLNFKGDNANVNVNRQLGETLSIVGGETDATKLADNNIGVIGDANGSLAVKLAKTLKDLTSAEFKDGDKTTIVNGSGITINSNNPTKTVSLTDNGLNNGGNKITNIAEGTDGTDAVNVNQLNKLGNNTIKLGADKNTATETQQLNKAGGLQFDVVGGDNQKYVETKASGSQVAVDLTKETKDKIDNAADNNLTNITNEGKKVITGLGTVVKAGDNVTVDETSDATTGQKTYTVNAIAQNLGDALLSYKSNGDASTKQSVKVSDGLDFVNGNYTTASVDKNGVVKYDVVLGEAPTINDGKPGVPGQPGVNGKDGIATVKTVVDIINNSGWLGNATGNVASGSTAAATIVKPGTTVNYAAGQNLNIKQDVATNGDHTYTYALEKDLTDINSIANGTHKIELGKDGKTIISGGDVSVDNHKITDVANGTVDANSKDAVNGSQLYATNQNVTNNTQNITKNTDDIAKGLNFKGDNANVNVNRQLGETLSIVGGETDATKLADNNIGVIGDANGSLTVKLAKTLKDLTSAEFKDGDKTTIVNGSGITINSNNPTKTVSLTDNGLNNGGNKITNVAEGTDGTDAVNVNQLNKVVNASVSTEKVKAADDANNLATVTPQNGQKFGDPNATYEVSVSKDKVEQTAELTYKANGDATSAKQTTLQKGLDFQATGDYLTASVADNGVVNYAVTIGKIAVGQDGKAGADGTKGADGTDGKNGIATTEDISKAINSSGWKATAKADGGKLIDTATSTVVKPGNEVAFAAGKNLSVKQTINGENQQYTYSLDSELTNLDKIVVNGKDGQNGKDGVTITGPNGQNGEDGKVGISGKDGKDAVSISGKDGVGHIGLTGPAGKDGQNATADISVKKGKAGVDGEDGITRIVYQDKDGKEHEVATHDDGMKYYGDAIANTSVIKKRLNEQVNVVGGITDRNKLSEENNIGVISDGSNNLTARLAKNLNGIESITNGKSSIVFNQNGGTTIKGGDVSVDGNKITHVQAGDVSANSTDAVNGSQLYNVTNTINKGLDFGTQSTGSDAVIHKNLGEKLEIVGKGEKADTEYDATNIKTITENGKVVVALAKDLTANKVTVGEKGADGKDGVDGTIGVNGKDGSSVVINGKDGSIGLNGKDGANGLTIKGADGKAGVDGKDGESKTRIVYETKDPKDPNKTITEEVATLNDGLRFKGDTGESIAKKLNEELEILGRLGKNADVTDKNLRVDNENGRLILKMAKQLQDLTSATFINNMGGKSVIDGNGLVITSKDAPANKTVSVTDKGLNNGGNQIVNVDSGLKDASGNKVSLANATGDTLNNAVNVGDLKESVNSITDPSKGGGFGLTDEKGQDVKAKLGETVTVKGDGSVTTKVVTEDGKSKLQIGLDKDVTIGNNNEPGTITVKGENGKDGVTISGKDSSIGLKGADGKDGIALNGKDGTIGINGKDGSSGSITMAQGKAGVDGKDGDTKTRMVYETKDNAGNITREEVATLNDGLKFTGNNGVVNNHTLNSLVTIKGEGVSKEDSENFKSASGNINVKADGNGTLEAQLAKDLKNIDSISNKDGQKLEFKEGGTTISGGNLSVDGNKITNVKAGEADTDAVNVKQLKDGLTQATAKVEAGKNMEVTPTKNADGSTTYTVKTKDNVDFTTVTTGNTTMNDSGITIKASDSSKNNVTLTNKGLDNGGNKVVNVADGEISSTSKDAINGSQLHNTKQELVNKGLDFGTQSGSVIHKNLGEKLEIVGEGTKADTNYSAENVKTITKNGKVVVALDKDLKANSVTVGKAGKDGVDGTIGVNGKDGSSVVINGKDGSIGLTGPRGADGKAGSSVTLKPEKGSTTVAEKDAGKEIDRIKYTDGNNTTREVATMDDGLKFTGDDGITVNRTLGSNLNITGGAKDATTKDNIRVVNDGKGGLKTQLANNVTLDSNGSVNIGGTTLNQGGLTINNGPSITSSGISGGGQRITNVAPGVNGTDAVNVNQLNQRTGDIYNRIDRNNKDLRAGIAGANAAVGLPQAFLPGKSMLAASAGTYKNEGAVAVGFSRISDNGKIIIKAQGNANTRGDVGASAGIGYQW